MLTSLAGGMLQDFINAQDPVPVPTSSNTADLGVVIRDSHGEIMGAMSVHVPLPQSVTEVEALACRHAVSFAIDLGLHEVIFEGD
uniref:RNase H type-1 domain-containing protein n=1 Tax=Quercus lobata TaxID=97700 RepID=A0A7N2MLG1_QUELO